MDMGASGFDRTGYFGGEDGGRCLRMIATKFGHATGIEDYFGVGGLGCVGFSCDSISLIIASCSWQISLEIVDVGNEYWWIYFLDHVDLFLDRVIGSMWHYAIPAQRCWLLLGNQYMYDPGWLDLTSLTDQLHDLVFCNIWYNGGDGDDPTCYGGEPK
jgi:hypothetical protein